MSVARVMSSMQTQQPGSLPDYRFDPYQLLEDDLKDVYEDIRRELIGNTTNEELRTIATYYFGGQGKALRPMVAILIARAVNYHKDRNGLLTSQRQVAMISEMIHSASLIHDDVIDQSDFRRGKPSVNALWSQKKVTMAGDFILAVATMMIARLRSDDVTLTLSQVITDLVQGEFMQLGSKETENERFAHYLTKTYRKTASLLANSAKAVAMLSGADGRLSEVAFQYGRNIGLAFQLVDDLLDFVSSSDAMGKPTAADLKLGLATAPVLFACERYPELNPMIMRRFQEPGDVEKAFELVHESQGLEQTRFLAKKHCVEAVRLAQTLAESPYQKSLLVVSDLVINRIKAENMMMASQKLVNKQFNSPVLPYSSQAIRKALDHQTQILSNDAVGIDFNQLTNLKNSAVLRIFQEEEERKRAEKAGFKRIAWPPQQKGEDYFYYIQENPEQAQNQQLTKSFEAPPEVVTLKRELPTSQAPSPVPQAQPVATNPYSSVLYIHRDLVWPPAYVKEQIKAENRARIELAKGPICRPRRVNKDYADFFAQYSSTNNYLRYRAPPGTQYFTHTAYQH